jgi:hypothetical protein
MKSYTAELLAAIGILAIGYCVWQLAGAAGIVGYIGALLVVVALLLARHQARSQARQ